MSDPDYKPAQHNRKGSLFYNVKENSKRRSVTYQLLNSRKEKKTKKSAATAVMSKNMKMNINTKTWIRISNAVQWK